MLRMPKGHTSIIRLISHKRAQSLMIHSQTVFQGSNKPRSLMLFLFLMLPLQVLFVLLRVVLLLLLLLL